MEVMRRARARLVDAGYAAEKIEIKIENMTRSVALDILQEAQNGYHLIVTGRTGASGIKEFFLGSISQKIISGAKEVSVLIAS
jgi:nucleotide-binding universal stress UspA family protein